MVLPIGLALFALAVGTGLLGLLAAVGDVPEDTTSLATMIGLGVGIDYALFVLTRYRQLVQRRAQPASRRSHTPTPPPGRPSCSPAPRCSIAIVGLRASGLPAIAMMGYGTAIVVALSVLAAVTLLPALLGAVGHRIDGLLARTRRRRLGRRSRPAELDRRRTMGAPRRQHPVRYAVGQPHRCS